mmetsp:Transcript_17140/g.24230  ORF Transcript_17140/g.24230 Transcript_17140/m.24230 type:complete len:92 (+) Transcript_17140:2309-2584(+)
MVIGAVTKSTKDMNTLPNPNGMRAIIGRVHEFGLKEKRKPINSNIQFSHDKKGEYKVGIDNKMEIVEAILLNANYELEPTSNEVSDSVVRV